MKISNKLLGYTLLLLTFSYLTAKSVKAQLIPDNSLGKESSLVNPSIERDLIEGGAIRNNNLFHSFQEFNVNPNQKVYFSNPDNITNILTRVTGNNISRIFGTLGINGGANLFLVNPNGIVFSENAFLDISGSFSATTAESIFTDNFEFNTQIRERSPLLKVNLTPGLQYGKGTIRNRGNLTVGKDFSIFAGNLDLQGRLIAGGDVNLFAADILQIRDDLTNPFIASAGSNLLVEGNQVDIFALSHSESGFFSNEGMILSSPNTIKGDARFYSGRDFQINGNLSSPNDPILLVGGNANLGDYTGASLHILAGGSVTLGDVEINAADSRENSINPNNRALFNGSDTFASLSEVSLSDGRVINIDGSSKPTLDVRAGIDWNSFPGGLPSNFNPGNVNVNTTLGNTATNADITTGNIRIADGGDGGQLLFTNRYRNNQSLTGDILVNGEIDAKDALQGGKLDFDSRGGINVNGIVDASGLEVETVNGGDISLLAADDITVNDGAGIIADGAISGNIILNAGGDISLTATNSGDVITSNSYGNESGVTGGNIDITANSLFLRDGARIRTDNYGAVGGGNININASSNIELTGENIDLIPSIIRSDVLEEATGDGGNLNIKTQNLIIRDGGYISASTAGNGNGGTLSIIASDIELSGTSTSQARSSLFARVSQGATGNGGKLSIETGNLNLLNGGRISATTFGGGNTGTLNIIAENIELSGIAPNGQRSRISAVVNSESTGDGNKLSIETGNLIVRDGARISVSTLGNGDSGNIKIIADNIQLIGTSPDGSSSSRVSAVVDTDATGDGGNLSIETGNLIVRDGARIATSTSGKGNAGSLNIIAKNISINESPDNRLSTLSTAVNPGAEGDGGDLTIQTENLTVGDRAQIVTTSIGDLNGGTFGNAGKLDITAEQITINQQGNILSFTAGFNTGRAGEININTGTLQNSGAINASTIVTKAPGGDINIKASESVTITGGGFEALQENFVNDAMKGTLGLENLTQGVFTTSFAEGAAGNVLIETPNLTVNNGGLVATTALGSGEGGNIDINVTDSITLDNSLLATGTFSDGLAGNINLNARKLTAIGGAQVLTTTFDKGKAGNLKVSVSESIDLIDPSEQGITSGLFASSSQTASGSGGDINVKTGDFNIVDRAAVSVSGEGEGNAGNIDLEAVRLFLDSGSITAQSVSGEGGNIELSITDLLLLRNNSTISTRAGTEASGGGSGGNITIDGGLIVAIPNEDSDINANAFEGNGGNIDITTPGIFGIQFRDRNTPNSDITASSEFGVDGEFNLDLTAVDPNNGLIELPENVTDAADRISAGCATDEEARFVATGRGGIPVNPRQTLREEIVLQDLRNTVNSQQLSVNSEQLPVNRVNNHKTIVEELLGGLLIKMVILNLLLMIII
jgi:filamentous hemagglutinin family protein